MKPATNYALVLVTAPGMPVARRLARSLLKQRLIACANLLPRLESHYWWKGKIERGAETLLILKTTSRKLAALERAILAAHPYDTPEILQVSLKAGNKRYLDWITESVR